eukprot:PhF_6_TR43397/c1_g1_i1/m.66633
MAVWFGMDVQYLNPGVLTIEEHHLLLLHSRAYFEKWKTIHSLPREILPHKRVKKGGTGVLRKIAAACGMKEQERKILEEKFLLDDAAIIAMNPLLWTNAHLDPKLRSQFTGHVLREAKVNPIVAKDFYMILNCLRCFRVNTLNGVERIIQFKEATTLYDLYQLLDIPVYNGQLRVLDFTQRGVVISLRTEDDYFDFLYSTFADCDLIGRIPAPGLCCSKYEINILPESTRDKTGVWF